MAAAAEDGEMDEEGAEARLAGGRRCFYNKLVRVVLSACLMLSVFKLNALFLALPNGGSREPSRRTTTTMTMRCAVLARWRM
jgi:hypothetical protein